MFCVIRTEIERKARMEETKGTTRATNSETRALEEQQKQQQKLLERQQQFQEEISSKASFASSSQKSSENNSNKTKKSNLCELNEVASKQKQQQQPKKAGMKKTLSFSSWKMGKKHVHTSKIDLTLNSAMKKTLNSKRK